MGIFMVDPMIQLMLLNAAVITPATDCFDFRLANQTCDTDVMVDYYFWNITNADDASIYIFIVSCCFLSCIR